MAGTSYDATTTEETPNLDASTKHNVLKDARRRHVLDALEDLSSPMSLDELAETTAAREHEVTADDATDQRRVAIALHHAHLPVLADAGLIDYVAETNTIEPDRDAIEALRH
jgi:hypothetical protein